MLTCPRHDVELIAAHGLDPHDRVIHGDICPMPDCGHWKEAIVIVVEEVDTERIDSRRPER